MIIRPRAVCQTTIPDDGYDDENGEFIFAGRTITQVLADGLRARDREVTEPEFLGDHGWGCDAISPHNNIEVVVAVIDEIYVTVTYSPNIGDRLLGRKDPLYREILRDVDAILRSDARFSDVKWYANHHSGAQPADHPIGDI